MTESGFRHRAIVIFSLLIRVEFLLVTQTKPKPQNQKLARVHNPLSPLSLIGAFSFSIFQLLLTLFFSCISRISICTQFRIRIHFFGFVLGFFTLPCSCIFLLFYFDLHMPKIVSSSSWFYSFIVQPIIYGITATSSELCSSLLCCNIHNLSKRGGKTHFLSDCPLFVI